MIHRKYYLPDILLASYSKIREIAFIWDEYAE